MRETRVILAVVMVLLVITLAIPGCAKPAPTPASAPAPKPAPAVTSAPTPKPSPAATSAPAPKPSPAPAAADPSKVFKLKFHSDWARVHPSTVAPLDYFIKPVVERSKGRLDITLFATGELLGPNEALNAVSKGTVAMAFHAFTYDAGIVPEFGITSAPGLFKGTGEVGSLFMGEVGKTLDNMLQAKHNVKLFYPILPGTMNMWLAKKPVNTMADLKGLKIRAMGSDDAKAIEMLGASSVSMPSPEVLTALRTGVLDGAIWGSQSVVSLSAWDVIRYNVANPLVYATGYIIINLDVWKSFPPDLQKLISDTAAEATKYTSGVLSPQRYEEEKKLLEGKGVKYNTLPSEEWKKWQTALSPWWDWYAGKGVAQKQILDIAKRDLGIK